VRWVPLAVPSGPGEEPRAGGVVGAGCRCPVPPRPGVTGAARCRGPGPGRGWALQDGSPATPGGWDVLMSRRRRAVPGLRPCCAGAWCGTSRPCRAGRWVLPRTLPPRVKQPGPSRAGRAVAEGRALGTACAAGMESCSCLGVS